MKKIILLLLVLYSMSGFAIAQEGLKDKTDIPFYDFKKIEESYLLKKYGISDTIWVPVSATGEYSEGTEFHHLYEYYTDGWIKSWTYLTSIEKAVRSYANHYPVPLIPTYKNMEADTTTFYRKKPEETGYTPTRRYFYDYSNYPACLLEYNQNWVEGRWETTYKTETCYKDTLTISRYPYLRKTYNKDEIQTDGLWYIPVFDNNENVVEEYTKQYKATSGKYVDVWKNELFYEGSVLKKAMCYEYYNGSYYPFNKHTDLEWHEYYGFGNGTFFEWNTSDRRNKCASRKVWLADKECTRNEQTWTFYLLVKTHWQTDGALLIDDTIYYYSPSLDTLSSSIISNNYHDGHDNLTYDKNITYYGPEYYGFNDTMSYGLDSLVNHYDIRSQLYRYDLYMERYINYPDEDPINTDGIEYSYQYCEVDSFRYYLPLSINEELPCLPQALQIFPNPSGDGMIKIVTVSDMRRISLYSLNGKMLHDATASGKKL